MSDLIHYSSPTKDLALPLGEMARWSFCDTFAHLSDPLPFAQFLEEAYGPGGSMERDLANPSFAGRWP